MKALAARLVSVIAHPFILSAGSTLISADAHHASPSLFKVLVLVLVVLGGIAIGFALWHVLTGRWKHLDAVEPSERIVLNGFLATLLLISSALAWRYFPEPELACGLLVSGSAIVIALLISPWLKISLHACFAAIATGILWPASYAFLAGAVFSVAAYWSRLVLRRHSVNELAVGSVVGIVCAMGYHALTR